MALQKGEQPGVQLCPPSPQPCDFLWDQGGGVVGVFHQCPLSCPPPPACQHCSSPGAHLSLRPLLSAVAQTCPAALSEFP